MNELKKYNATAFVSCSLRPEDDPFIRMVEKILDIHGIKFFGTVGRHSASPVNPAELMRTNIPLADMVVIIATPRYVQTDIQTGKVNLGLSEMVHAESGMAYMLNKPVIVFVQEGTNVGNFLPNVTQYIVLKDYMDANNKSKIIASLLLNAHKIVEQMRDNQSKKQFNDFGMTALAAVGGAFLFSELFLVDEPNKTRKKKK
ncbi:MAG: hypothetical protein ACO1G9_09785 [Bacteroidota bacterium]